MPKFQFQIKVDAANENDAKKVAQILQNFASNTSVAQQKEIHSKITKNPKFFQKIAKYLKYA